MVPDLLVLACHYFLEQGEEKGSVEAAPISPGFPIALEGAEQVVYFDIEGLVILELVHEGLEGETVPDEGRLGLDFLPDHLLLVFVHFELLLELFLVILGDWDFLLGGVFLFIRHPNPIISFQKIIKCIHKPEKL